MQRCLALQNASFPPEAHLSITLNGVLVQGCGKTSYKSYFDIGKFISFLA